MKPTIRIDNNKGFGLVSDPLRELLFIVDEHHSYCVRWCNVINGNFGKLSGKYVHNGSDIWLCWQTGQEPTSSFVPVYEFEAMMQYVMGMTGFYLTTFGEEDGEKELGKAIQEAAGKDILQDIFPGPQGKES
jgi:hypothetical protein